VALHLHLVAKVVIFDENAESWSEIFTFFIKNAYEFCLYAFFFISLHRFFPVWGYLHDGFGRDINN
jgi:hypothetical protein